MLALIAEIGTGKLRTRDSFGLGKSGPGKVATKITIIFRAFSGGKPEQLSRRDRRPLNDFVASAVSAKPKQAGARAKKDFATVEAIS